MGIKKQIKKILPYSYIINRYDSSKFINDYVIWKRKQFTDKNVKSLYRTIVSVQGFGFSGSGAVVDLLREYPSCQVLGGVDDDSVDQTIGHKFDEFDFLRHSGGFYDIEKHLGHNNIFINDGVINRFVKLVYYSSLYRNFPDCHNAFYYFLDSITDIEMTNLNARYFNANIFRHDNKSSIFFLKDLSVKDYRGICNRCLNLIFNSLYEEGKDILVADQMCCDFEFDIERDMQYIDNLKSIIIYRDPRDIYSYAVSHNVEWIAHDNVSLFINWYKHLLKKFDKSISNALIVRFEDLILNYDKTIPLIESYLLLDNHKYKFMNLDPNLSKKNIGIWKESSLPKDDFDSIKKELGFLCYN